MELRKQLFQRDCVGFVVNAQVFSGECFIESFCGAMSAKLGKKPKDDAQTSFVQWVPQKQSLGSFYRQLRLFIRVSLLEVFQKKRSYFVCKRSLNWVKPFVTQF